MLLLFVYNGSREIGNAQETFISLRLEKINTVCVHNNIFTSMEKEMIESFSRNQHESLKQTARNHEFNESNFNHSFCNDCSGESKPQIKIRYW